MPRKFTQNGLDFLDDEEFCQRHGLLEKVLYGILKKKNESDNAGLGRITLRRWLQKASPATEEQVLAALANLELAKDVYFDFDTEEFLVRRLMVDEQIGRFPNIMINAARSAAMAHSPKLAAVLLEEFPRVEITRPDDPALRARLDRALADAEQHCRDRAARWVAPREDPAPETLAETVPRTVPETVAPVVPETGSPPPDSEPFAEPLPEPSVVVAVAVAPSRSVLSPPLEKKTPRRPSHLRLVADSPEQIPPESIGEPTPPDTPPPPSAPAAAPIPATTGPACGPDCLSRPCGVCADRVQAVAEHRAAVESARHRCGMCDPDTGWRREPFEVTHLDLPVVWCDHRTAWTVEDWTAHARTLAASPYPSLSRAATEPAPPRPGQTTAAHRRALDRRRARQHARLVDAG
ncbi:hypothetical protein ACTD5D_00370 [Nocardia takedensis]|uniref:hypothetical protein n=1 Tax=Nocardia takedensis TaxID=259390 RepID=UPI003F776C66